MVEHTLGPGDSPFDSLSPVAGWAKPRDKSPLVQHKPHIQAMLNKVMKSGDFTALGAALDGELYNNCEVTQTVTKKMAKADPTLVVGEMHTEPMHFEDICSGIKGADSVYGKYLQYHIFDIMDPTKPFKARYAHVSWWYSVMCLSVPGFSALVKLVPCKTVYNMEQLVKLMDKWSATDEGLVIRDPNECYAFDKRTNGCMRWKYKLDAEYEIVDIIEGTGKNVGVATFVCVTPEGRTFNAASNGKLEQRKKYFTDRDRLIGQQATISYQNLSKINVPRFPQCKAVRDD